MWKRRISRALVVLICCLWFLLGRANTPVFAQACSATTSVWYLTACSYNKFSGRCDASFVLDTWAYCNPSTCMTTAKYCSSNDCPSGPVSSQAECNFDRDSCSPASCSVIGGGVDGCNNPWAIPPRHMVIDRDYSPTQIRITWTPGANGTGATC